MSIGSLPLFHQLEGQTVLLLGDGEAAEPKRRLLLRAGARLSDDMQRAIDEGVRIAFVAYEDEAACKTAAINLRCAGMLVNVVDQPALCDFTTPSILDRDPLLIAFGTGGASAGLAKHVRLRIDRMLPQGLGKLANALARIRPALRAKLPDGADRRAALDAALQEGGALDPMQEGASDRVDAWLAGLDGNAAQKAAHTEEIALTSNDPEELTLRAARLLGTADTILFDRDVPDAILARARADAARLPIRDAQPANAYEELQGLTVILRSAAQS
jgi:uroporphyrin-III C-methyltransferase/precorrin-2 dehydrogenase/sirohydrochlorin ferrochelatase